MRVKRRAGRVWCIATLAVLAWGAAPAGAPAASGWYLRPPTPAPGIGYVYLGSVGNSPGLVRAQPNIPLWRISDHIKGFQVGTVGGPPNSSCLWGNSYMGGPFGGLRFGNCFSRGGPSYALWEFQAVLGAGRVVKRPPSAGNSYRIVNLLSLEHGKAYCLGVSDVVPGARGRQLTCGSDGTTWRLAYLSYP